MRLGKSIDEVRDLTNEEFAHWLALYRLYPGLFRPDWMQAQTAAILYNANRGKGPVLKLEDFLFAPPKRVPVSALFAYFRQHG